jgi:DHA1 family multidrug resistance protein-like MFS transporter
VATGGEQRAHPDTATRPPASLDGHAEREPAWVASFGAVVLCQLLNVALFSSVQPFLPLYLRELGETEAAAVAWTGAMLAVSSGLQMLVNPLWGSLADRFGRKAMVMRAQLSTVVTFALLPLTGQAWQVFAVRSAQGLVGGAGPALTTLAATILPPKRLGFGLGLFQTAQFIGISVGPLVGGLAAAALGFRGAFGVTAGLMVVASIVAWVVIHEPAAGARQSSGSPTLTFGQRLAFISGAPRLRAPLVATFAYQTAYTTSVALLPLHLYNLAGSGADASAAVGLVLTVTALGSALGATTLGWLAGRLGAPTIALVSFAATAALLIPQAWLGSPTEFAAVRLCMGFAACGVMPSLRTVLAEEAGRHDSTAGNMGAIYGLNQSAFAGGMAGGSALAALVASFWGLPATYTAAGLLIGLTGVWWLGIFGLRQR